MYKDDFKAAGAGIAALVGILLIIAVLIGAVTLVGWRLNWWFTQKNADMQAHVIRHGYSNQTTLRDDLTRKLGDVQTITVQIAATNGDLQASLKAQRYAIATIVCREASQITGDPLPQEQLSWVTENCSAGSINTNSTLNKGN